MILAEFLNYYCRNFRGYSKTEIKVQGKKNRIDSVCENPDYTGFECPANRTSTGLSTHPDYSGLQGLS